jgi:hypothetical protein
MPAAYRLATDAHRKVNINAFATVRTGRGNTERSITLIHLVNPPLLVNQPTIFHIHRHKLSLASTHNRYNLPWP